MIQQTVIANAGYDKASGEAELEKGMAGLVSYGTLFLANPDLPKRFEKDAALNEPEGQRCLAVESKVMSIIHF